MEFDWVAIAFGDIVWIALAFACGLAARAVGVPPLVGFLAAGFLLKANGGASGEVLAKLSDLGITLLLFTVGLKLNLGTLLRPHVWGVTLAHTSLTILFGALLFLWLGGFGLGALAGLSWQQTTLLAFAMSFSSTVFVVKVLEDSGEVTALHGRVAIGILIVQDVFAVMFLAASMGKLPSPWAAALLLLVPLRSVLHALLERAGHGELLVLYGLLLALGGAEVFEWAGLKGDLGALILGVLIGTHAKADEVGKTLFGFKDLFLLGFFLSIGLNTEWAVDTLLLGAALTPLILLKGGLFFALMLAFRLRARTALIASANLTNFSEFGLIVTAIAVGNGWLASDWLVALAVALALSFVVAAGVGAFAKPLYARHAGHFKAMQRSSRIPEDDRIDLSAYRTMVIGMGGVGAGAYDAMRAREGATVIGVDIDPVTEALHRRAGREVITGDPSDTDFWERLVLPSVPLRIMVALPNRAATVAVIERMRADAFTGEIAATAKFEDEVDAIAEAGASMVFNLSTEAGAGFAALVETEEEMAQ
ncbi:MAG: cation:proton antiporter [Pseudomonadota bacterium]